MGAIVNQISRRQAVICSMASAILAALPVSQGRAARLTPMKGSWRGVFRGVTLNLVILQDWHFSEQEVSGNIMTMQTGMIRETGEGVITFDIEDWEPKTRMVFHPTGTVGGYNTEERNSKPPGGTYRVSFNGNNVMIFEDLRWGGTVTYYRVH